jgi:hypothetical protein
MIAMLGVWSKDTQRQFGLGASTHNPIRHGFGIIGAIIRFVSLRHPLVFYGIPGLIFLVVAAYFMGGALELFSNSRFISTNMIIVSVGTAVIGVVLLVTGVILYTLAAMLRERPRD